MLLEVVLLLLLLGFLVYLKTAKPRGMPPGSFGLPVIGSLPSPTVHLTQHCLNLKRKYGDLITTKWGDHVVVVLANHHLIKKALNHPEFQGRPNFFSFNTVNYFMNAGVILAEGKVWANNHRFLLRHLRDLGMGKTRLETSIQEESLMLIQYLEKQNLEEPMELDWSLNVAVVNVIWQMLASRRYEADDEEIGEFCRRSMESFKIIQGPLFLVDLMPWLQTVLPRKILEKYTNVDKLVENRDAFQILCKRTIKEHQDTLDTNNPRDLLDYYLMEIEATKHDPDTTFKGDHMDLFVVMADLFAAGSETTSTTLRWMILYMAIYPEIQKKAHMILDEVVPEGNLPSIDHREQLAYIDALLLDVMRMASLIPNGVIHKATSTVFFEGYTIPKGTLLLPCLEMCHHDPALWEKPNTLYPEHFLDESGKLNSKREGFMPFAVGRRQCLGESLARMEVFIFASALLHRFIISSPPGVTLDAESDPAEKLLNSPKPFKVMLKRRFNEKI